ALTSRLSFRCDRALQSVSKNRKGRARITGKSLEPVRPAAALQGSVALVVVALELAVAGGLHGAELAAQDAFGLLVLAVRDRDLGVAGELEGLAQRGAELGHELVALLLVDLGGGVGRLRLGREHGRLELAELLERRRARFRGDALAERLQRRLHL